MPRRWEAEPHLRTRGSMRGAAAPLCSAAAGAESRAVPSAHTGSDRGGGPSPCAGSGMGWGRDGGSVSLCPQSPRGALVKRIGFRCHI